MGTRFEWKAHECSRWCKVHYFYHFDHKQHMPLPHTWNYMTSRHGWVSGTVFVGPPAWRPKRPTNDQMTNMEAHCPHTQGDLTCGTCLRHTFRPLEI